MLSSLFSSPMVEQSLTTADNSTPPLRKKKKRLQYGRFEREFIGMMKNKRKRKRLMKLLAPDIQALVQEELKCQSASSVPRSPVNQIQAPDAISQLHFKNVFSPTFFTDTYIAPIDIIIRRGDSGETIATGSLSSIRVELVVLPGDFEKEVWTAEECKDKVVSPRKNKGNLLMGTKEITLKRGAGTFNDIKFTDISGKTTSSGSFRFGVIVLQGNNIQDNNIQGRIMEARSEPFVVKDKRGESSQKHDRPLLVDKIWRLRNIRKNGPYCGKLNDMGVETVQEFLQAYNLDAHSLEDTIGMQNKKWEETLRHAKQCDTGDECYKYSCSKSNVVLLFNSIYEVIFVTRDGFQSFQPLDHLLPYEKVWFTETATLDLVENEKKQLYQDQKGILKYNGPNPLHELPKRAFIQESSLLPWNTNVFTPCQNVLARTDYMNFTMLASQGQVMENLPQQEGNEQPFVQMHGTLPAGQHEQQDSQSLQNYQPSEGPSTNYKAGAADVSDFPHGHHMNNFTEGGWLHSMDSFDESFLNSIDPFLHDESFPTVDTSFQKPKALIQGMVWAFISLRKPRI
ncbi:Calmodulin binding-like protein [Cinnamomum micranthum f. kanehirae]|uniref:Calmodulin binding-like protein n=1 Tax=Cinnamomum micranthum f. kanehirae TaxID=337451 RepID=A0A3S4PTA5_9MAGN|nr:Calmodulin binding-like protein [Cinnamomum micranthum f. kanehirae]